MPMTIRIAPSCYHSWYYDKSIDVVTQGPNLAPDEAHRPGRRGLPRAARQWAYYYVAPAVLGSLASALQPPDTIDGCLRLKRGRLIEPRVPRRHAYSVT
jgi:hypothetical protein